MLTVDYKYYSETFHGQMAEEDFKRLSRRASAWLDQVTFGRLQGAWTADERVKDACCAAADILRREEQGGEVASETLGRWTRNYAVSGKTTAQQMYEVAVRYLGTTGLLYRGVML